MRCLFPFWIERRYSRQCILNHGDNSFFKHFGECLLLWAINPDKRIRKFVQWLALHRPNLNWKAITIIYNNRNN